MLLAFLPLIKELKYLRLLPCVSPPSTYFFICLCIKKTLPTLNTKVLFSECNWGFNNLQREKFYIPQFQCCCCMLKEGEKENVHSMLKHFNLFLFISFAYSLHFTSVLYSLCVYPHSHHHTVVFYIIFSSLHFFYSFLSFFHKK